MTKLDWRKPRDDRLLRRKGAEIHEDYLPRKPIGEDKGARPVEVVRKRKRPPSKPKIGKDGLTKAQRRKKRQKNQEALEVIARNTFRRALNDPNGAIQRAARKTRKRWARSKKK